MEKVSGAVCWIPCLPSLLNSVIKKCSEDVESRFIKCISEGRLGREGLLEDREMADSYFTTVSKGDSKQREVPTGAYVVANFIDQKFWQVRSFINPLKEELDHSLWE